MMGRQVAKRDVLAAEDRGLQRRARALVDPFVEPQLAAPHRVGEQRTGDRFGDRTDLEARVGTHRRSAFGEDDLDLAAGADPPADDDDAARHFSHSLAQR